MEQSAIYDTTRPFEKIQIREYGLLRFAQTMQLLYREKHVWF